MPLMHSFAAIKRTTLRDDASFDLPQLDTQLLFLDAAEGVSADASAIQLNGSSQYGTAQTEGDFDFGTGDFTISAWVYADSTASHGMVCAKQRNTGGSFGFRLIVTDAAKFRFTISADGSSTDVDITTTNGISTGQWYFVVARYTTGDVGTEASVRFYSTSALVENKTASHSTGMFNNDKDFAVGSLPLGGTYFAGRIDCVGVWKGRAFTDAECLELWNSGAGKTYSQMSAAEKTTILAFWNLNESSGNRLDSVGSNYLTPSGTPGASAGHPSNAAVDEDAVAAWTDQSSAGVTVVQGTIADRPTYQTNSLAGYPIVEFNGSTNDMDLSSVDFSTTGFMIAGVTSVASDAVSTIFRQTGDTDNFIRFDDRTHFSIGQTAPEIIQQTIASVGSGYFVFILTRDSPGVASDATFNLYIGGTAYAVGSFSAAADYDFDRLGVLNGNLPELRAWSGEQSAADRDAVGLYLANKYGLPWHL